MIMATNTPTTTEGFWYDTRQRDAMLVDVLAAILRHGPMDDERIARFCLTPMDLLGLIPDDVKTRNARNMVEALIHYLDGPMSINSFAESLAAWRESAREARGSLDWSKLPPVTHRLALCYASELTGHALQQGWLTPSDRADAPGWRLTEAGMAAIETLKQQLK
jgi:hypothetical protein